VVEILEECKVIESNVEGSIGSESHDIETNKIKVETNDTFPSEVYNNLGIKTERPGYEISPSNDVGGNKE